MTNKRKVPNSMLNRRWVRVKRDGFVMEWNEHLENNTDVENISEIDAFAAMGFTASKPAARQPRKSSKPAKQVDMGNLPDDDSAE